MERCRAVIDLRALRANFDVARRAAQGAEVIAVLKAEAYGHGATAVAKTLAAEGCSRLAVVTVDEGLALRDAGVELPILVLGGLASEGEAREACARHLTPVLHDARPLAWLSAAARSGPVSVHVEVDTGMHRMGVPVDATSDLLAAIADCPRVELEGLYTHLARADEPDLAPSIAQLDAFQSVLESARAAGMRPARVHFANSAGLLVGAPLRQRVPLANAVRPGLMLYGVRPAPHFDVELAPVMTLRARVAMVRDVPKGDGVGYGAEFRATRDTRIATLSIGYEDGIPVSTSNRGSVCIRDRRFPIAGRVSMDFTTVEVGDAEVAPGDEAVIFGGSGAMARCVEEAAADAGTIAYELLVRVGTRVPRVLEGVDAAA